MRRALLVTWLFLAAPSMAADLPTLISFPQLELRLGDPSVRLLDCRARADYEKGHRPGAVWVDAKAIEQKAARPGALHDPDAWRSWIDGLAIGPESVVYVYDANRQLDAARIWFLLRYLGVPRVGLVDGGYPLWEKEGRPVETQSTRLAPRPYPIRFQPRILAERSDVLAALKEGSAKVLDARSDEEHSGAAKKSKRAGRIPRACHLEWTNLVDADGRFLSRDDLRAKVEKSGIRPSDEVLTHCQGGGRASVNAFALELLGIRARNYYLGWSDWGNADDVPVESGPAASGDKD